MRHRQWCATFVASAILAAISATGIAAVVGEAVPAALAATGTTAFEAAHARAVTENPTGVALSVRFLDGRSTFRPGEIIRLDLQFSGTVPNQWALYPPRRYSCGRPDTETFRLDPAEGTVDPLADCSEGLLAWIKAWPPRPDGGTAAQGFGLLTPQAPLEERHQAVTVILNDFVRFDRPGKYRLFVTSRRVGEWPPPPDGKLPKYLDVTSPVVELEILPPDPQWAEARLSEAMMALGTKDRQAQWPAAWMLRFLGTDAAARELVRRRAVTGRFDPDKRALDYGVFGSPARGAVVGELEALVYRPDTPISVETLRTLTYLTFRQRYPDAKPEAYAGEAARAVERECLIRLTIALDKKADSAKFACLRTLLKIMDTDEQAEDPETAGLLPHVQRAAAKVIPVLDRFSQQQILDKYGHLLAAPALLPMFLDVFSKLPSGRIGYEEVLRRDALLRQILAISPDEGRRLILAELRRPAQELENRRVLTLLCDKTLPELDDHFFADATDSKNGENEMPGVRLLARYGSKAILERVKEWYGPRCSRLMSDYQNMWLAYVIRVDEPYGIARLREGLEARRGRPDNYSNVLSGVRKVYDCPAMEKVALEYLEDDSPQLVYDAATFLMYHASPAAKESLFKRYERWHEQWKGREKELEESKDKPTKNTWLRGCEQALFDALTANGAWLLTLKEVQRLEGLCLTPSCRFGCRQLIAGSAREVSVSASRHEGELSIFIDRFYTHSLDAAEKKIVQYPPGTTFGLWADSLPGADRRKLRTVLGGIAKAHGMTLRDRHNDPSSGTIVGNTIIMGDDN